MFLKIGVEAVITSEVQTIEKATHLVLPGVGAFDYGMQKLDNLNLPGVLTGMVQEGKVPILGICLGAQLMCRRSEEGVLPGLGWIDAEVKRFPNQVNGTKYTVPHMGWQISTPGRASKLTASLPDPPRFYFVHSYYMKCANIGDRLITNEYGVPFDAAFERENIIGVQFHPEKSHSFGKQLLKNFFERY
jgi:glutamine amidotransferase